MSTTLTPDLEQALAAYNAQDYQRAADLFTPIIAHDPDNVIAWYHRGQAHHQLGHYTAAANDLAVASRLAKRDARVWRRRAAACLMAGRDEEALSCVWEAHSLNASDPETQHLLGGIMFNNGDTRQSILAFEHAVHFDPTRAESKVGLAMSLLRAGRWAEAWPLFEHRRTIPGTTMDLYPGIPFWDGADPIAGDTILVRCEQGYGDSLQFVRYVPLLQALGANVVLETRPTLRRLFDLSFPHVWQVAEGEEIPSVQWQTSLMSLPMAFNTTPDNVPAVNPYLRADNADWDEWRGRLPRDALNVGYCWHGGGHLHKPQVRAIDERRSMSQATMERLGYVLPGPVLYWTALQQETLVARDWADTAALIDNLDLVITVDTAVAHLAGALGKPVWLLNRLGGCWRWLENREDTPWYPTMRIFTQRTGGDWTEVVDRVAVALGEWAREKGRG